MMHGQKNIKLKSELSDWMNESLSESVTVAVISGKGFS